MKNLQTYTTIFVLMISQTVAAQDVAQPSAATSEAIPNERSVTLVVRAKVTDVT